MHIFGVGDAPFLGRCTSDAPLKNGIFMPKFSRLCRTDVTAGDAPFGKKVHHPLSCFLCTNKNWDIKTTNL